MALSFSKLTGSITWQDGTPVQGFALVGLVAPKGIYGNAWASLFAGSVKIPIWTKIPIVDGAFEDVPLIYNSEIAPPNTKYAIWYYDDGGTLLGAPNSTEDAFVVEDTTVSPPVYINETLEAGDVLPSPATI